MTSKTTIAFCVLAFCGSAAAQQPPRPADSSRSVTLSLPEYNRLIDLAGRPPSGAAAVPVAAVVSSADLRVRVESESVRGTFTLVGDVLQNGLTRVALVSGAVLVNAGAGGRPLPLVSDGNTLAALVPGPGAFSLSLEWGASLSYRPGRASFVLPVPQAGSARTVLDLPGEQADVHLSSGLITRRTASGGRTIVEATLDPGSSTEVWWTMRDSAPAAVAREVRTLADVMTLVTLGDSDVRMVALIDVTVVQGELRTIAVKLPSGYEVTGITGNSLESSNPTDAGVILTVSDPAARSHQFLISLERPHEGGSFEIETGLVCVRDVQRERGEIAVEGVGTMELKAAEREGLQRIDVRELNASLQSLGRLPVLSAFRYQRTVAAPPSLALGVTRFADAGVLAAVADYATATTLVTSEGRALTEIVLQVRNRAQPFMKVNLPVGATIVSVQIAGESAKPVLGTDGIRVPLRRPGLASSVPYEVSFVYLHAGAPFAGKGDIEMTLPKMDVPIGMVNWEVFLPERYSARTIGGNAIDMRGLKPAVWDQGRSYRAGSPAPVASYRPSRPVRITMANGAAPGEIRGRATDESGANLPGVTIDLIVGTFRKLVITDGNGTFVASGVPSGQANISASLAGFKSQSASFDFDQAARFVDFELSVGMLMETITVSAATVDASSTSMVLDRAPAAPSQNVVNLQQRTAGVLPIRVDVPRAGTSHQFVKPLVVDQEVSVRLKYRRR
jgi:hypothetical protein